MAEKMGRERIASQIPYPEMYEERAVSRELTLEILSRPGTPERGATVTPIDLRRTPERISGQEILDSVSAHLGVSLGTLADDGAQREAMYQKELADINLSLAIAHRYIEDVLGFRVPAAEVHSRAEVVQLIRKTSAYSEHNKKGLENHAGYCALISAALAVFELQKKEAHTLDQEMVYLEKCLISSSDSMSRDPLFFKHFAGDTPTASSVVINDLQPQCRARISMRDKTQNSQITKYLMKPESTAQEALKDAIGIRLELGNERLEDAIIKLLQYFREHFAATGVSVEDKNLLGDKRLSDLKRRRTVEVPNSEEIPIFPDTNPLSADSFRAVKIVGNIRIPRGGTGMPIFRPIEIQLVLPDNKNESGLGSHAVYELKKQITVMTRLFGGCSEAWLTQRARKISDADGFAKNVIQGLQDPKVGFLMTLPRTRRVYAAADVYRRWLKADGLIEDPAIRDQLLHKVRSS